MTTYLNTNIIFNNKIKQIYSLSIVKTLCGNLNYIRPFYKGNVDDIHLLQKRMKKNLPQWNKHMTNAVKTIKEKVKQLPPLSLLQGSGQIVIETNASNKAWGGILIEKHGDKEEICGYASGALKNVEINYPSSHKEILAVKKTVNHFKPYLKPVKFIVRTDLKIMLGIFKNENLMAENSSKILK